MIKIRKIKIIVLLMLVCAMAVMEIGVDDSMFEIPLWSILLPFIPVTICIIEKPWGET